MTNETIRKKAIDKAVENGWEPESVQLLTFTKGTIFSHSFAKAFWGEEEIVIKLERIGEYIEEGEVKRPSQPINMEVTKPAWQHWLQQLVLEEEPLKYIEQWLK